MGAEGVTARDRFPLHLFDNLAEPKPDPRLAEDAAEAFPARFLGMSAKTGMATSIVLTVLSFSVYRAQMSCFTTQGS